MTCELAFKVQAYHDGEMPPDQREAFEAHLAGCAACAAELDQLRRLSAAFGPLRDEAVPNIVMHRLHAGVDRAATQGLRRLAEGLMAAAASILLLCTLGMALRDRPSPPVQQAWDDTELLTPATPEPAAVGDEQVALWIVQDLAGKDE